MGWEVIFKSMVQGIFWVIILKLVATAIASSVADAVSKINKSKIDTQIELMNAAFVLKNMKPTDIEAAGSLGGVFDGTKGRTKEN